MNAAGYKALIAATLLLAGCSEPPPPRSVSEFMENPNLLEAALVRCTQNRSESRYDAECVNAREAVRLSEKKNEEQRRAELEAESQRKRDALRRTQQAAAEARRRAAEAARRREEAEYLAQFGELPPTAEDDPDAPMSGNEPQAVIPQATIDAAPPPGQTEALPTGSNAPTIEVIPEDEPESDLEAIREELRRRGDDDGN